MLGWPRVPNSPNLHDFPVRPAVGAAQVADAVANAALYRAMFERSPSSWTLTLPNGPSNSWWWRLARPHAVRYRFLVASTGRSR